MSFLKKVFAEFSDDDCSTLAAALAYYTVFSLPPLLYLLLMIASLGMGMFYDSQDAEEKAEQMVQTQAAEMIGNEDAAAQIGDMIDSVQSQSGSWWKSLISIGGIIFGATGVMAALQSSLNKVWEVRPDPDESGIKDFIGKRLLSLGMILGLGFLLVISLVATTALSALTGQLTEMLGVSDFAGSVINQAVSFLVVFVMFAALFKFMPDVTIGWKEVFIGAAVTAALFTLGRWGMTYYMSLSDPGAQMGSAAASLAVILVWVYYSAMIFLLGAEFTQVYARENGHPVRPEPGAVRVVQTIERDGKEVT